MKLHDVIIASFFSSQFGRKKHITDVAMILLVLAAIMIVQMSENYLTESGMFSNTMTE